MSDEPQDRPRVNDARRAFLKRMAAVGFAAPLITTFEPVAAGAKEKGDRHPKPTTTPCHTSARPTTTTGHPTTGKPTTGHPTTSTTSSTTTSSTTTSSTTTSSTTTSSTTTSSTTAQPTAAPTTAAPA